MHKKRILLNTKILKCVHSIEKVVFAIFTLFILSFAMVDCGIIQINQK